MVQPREPYVQFRLGADQRVGAAVLFNGIRVGEVSELGLAPGKPRGVNATISVASTTPVRADTKVGLEFQGLTGVPVITLEGGLLVANTGEVPTLVADPGAGQGMTQAARDALRKVCVDGPLNARGYEEKI